MEGIYTAHFYSVLDFLGVGGLTPSGASQPPKFVLTSEKNSQKSQKYIADSPALWFPTIEYCFYSQIVRWIQFNSLAVYWWHSTLHFVQIGRYTSSSIFTLHARQGPGAYTGHQGWKDGSW